MATWLPHIKLSFGGPLGGGVEEWSNTVRFKSNADRSGNIGSIALTPAQLDAAMEDLEAPLKTWFSANATGISANATMTWLKLNMIGADGKQQERITHLREFAPANGGGGAAMPWFVTLALTMRTQYRRGRAHSGRIFPPLIAIPLAVGSPYISAAAATAAAATWATFLNAASAAIASNDPLPDGPSCFPVIASPATTTGPDPGGPVLLPVTGVVVDRVHDVQHRRTNRVPRDEGDLAPVTA